LTPHIGGSTEEAQYSIGLEVGDKLIKFINTGSTATSVNFPNLDLPAGPKGIHRILNIHKNVPGVLKVRKLHTSPTIGCYRDDIESLIQSPTHYVK
jgi:hypothetical protein